jgi:Ran GTPase-activating protein (RanGAP) involved in mRNA processing and transport
MDASLENIGLAGVKLIAEALRTSLTGGLTALDLSFNDLNDEGVSAVCEAIQSNNETKLASLNFRYNGIGPVGANAVAAMVAVTGGLTSLNLSSNQLCGLTQPLFGHGRGTYTAEGITAIADALRVNGGLTKISLAENGLGEEGTKAICEALEQNKTLKELDIRGSIYRENGNIGGTAGVKHVAKMLAVNGALTSVELKGNKLGDEGWGAIFAAICGNKDSKIMSMDVSGENIGPAGVKLIAEALRSSVTGALMKVR